MVGSKPQPSAQNSGPAAHTSKNIFHTFTQAEVVKQISSTSICTLFCKCKQCPKQADWCTPLTTPLHSDPRGEEITSTFKKKIEAMECLSLRVLLAAVKRSISGVGLHFKRSVPTSRVGGGGGLGAATPRLLLQQVLVRPQQRGQQLRPAQLLQQCAGLSIVQVSGGSPSSPCPSGHSVHQQSCWLEAQSNIPLLLHRGDPPKKKTQKICKFEKFTKNCKLAKKTHTKKQI